MLHLKALSPLHFLHSFANSFFCHTQLDSYLCAVCTWHVQLLLLLLLFLLTVIAIVVAGIFGDEMILDGNN